MFDTAKIKNKKRVRSKQIQPKSDIEILTVKNVRRVMPYFEIIPEQLFADECYQQLSRLEQGDFLRLMTFLWRDGGAHLDHPHLAKDMKMQICEWEQYKMRLLDLGLLVRSIDGDYIIQKGLRQQYLQTLDACEAKNRTTSALKVSCEDDLITDVSEPSF